MRKKLSKLIRLPAQDWCLLFKVGTVLLAARVALSLFCYGSIKRWLDRVAASANQVHVDSEKYQERVVWAVTAIGYRLFGDKPCLPIALATYYVLKCAGEEPKIRIGVTKENDQGLAAHAWVEHNGEIIIGGSHAPAIYQPLEDVR